MSDSPEGSASPMSPRRPVEEMKPSTSVSDDVNAVVERKITDLAEQLVTCITELSKDKQVTNKKMEEIATNMKKSLADIESGLQEQLNAMDLMSGDFNCCPPLNEHQIESMDEIAYAMRMHLKTAFPGADDSVFDGDDDMEEDNEIDGIELQYSPKLLMDSALAGQSILKSKNQLGRDVPEDADDGIQFSERVHKRLYHDSEGEGSSDEGEVEMIGRLPPRAKMIQAFNEPVLDEATLALRESLCRAEGLALRASKEVDESMEDNEPESPMTDDARKLEIQIRDLKKDYQAARRLYEENRDALEEEGATGSEVEAKYVETLKSDMKLKKSVLKEMLEERNLIRGFTEEDLEKRKIKKLTKKIEILEKRGTLDEEEEAEIENDVELFSSSDDDETGPNSGKKPRTDADVEME